MTRTKSKGLWYSSRLLGVATLMLALAGCGGGSSGGQGPAGPPGPGGPPGNAPPAASALSIVISSVTVNSPPVVNFTVTNEGGFAYPGIADTDLRFNIAKLIPASNGKTAHWQNYIETGGTAMHGSQERNRGRAGDVWGQLVDHGDGTYTYTFMTDITLGQVNCPAPCTEADGVTQLDLSYQPGLVHRVGIQQGNSALPLANAVFDFIPQTGAIVPVTDSGRDIVKTDNCNECHTKVMAHGSRYDTRLCVTCHNPGSWVDSSTPVDFKVMIHKIHDGENLPSGNGYHVGNSDFSDVVFPQDVRNCNKCHDADPASSRHTAQGDNWEMVPSMAACGSCHDNVDFSTGANHPGGVVNDDSQCTGCHETGGWAGSIAESHAIPGRAELANFQYNILEICGTPVGSDPMCPPGSNPTVKFSVTDPSGATTHEYGAAYNILTATTTDPEFTNSTARLTVDIAWYSGSQPGDISKRDYTNDCGHGNRPGRADAVTLGGSSAVTDNGDGTFTFNGALASPVEVIPDAGCFNANSSGATGTGAIALEGRMAAQDGTGAYTVRVPVTSQVAYFGITDTTPIPRRVVASAVDKCDNCHDVLSLHGNSRNNNIQLCVLCHNPLDSDVNDRAKDANGLPDPTQMVDGKVEESVDLKRMIHGIHAGAKTRYDGSPADGFREKGLVVGTNSHDFSDVRFPGVLSRCETCHVQVTAGRNTYDTYTLEDRTDANGGNWELPAQDIIYGSTVNSFPDPVADAGAFATRLADQSDDIKYSPIASVCTSCHDDTVARSHMMGNSAQIGASPVSPLLTSGKMDGVTQAVLEGNVEACPVCHGPGKDADVKVVHDIATAKALREYFP